MFYTLIYKEIIILFTWCARHMRSKSCLFKNFATTSVPKVNETPLSFSPQPVTSLSGSDHNKSHNKPTKNYRSFIYFITSTNLILICRNIVSNIYLFNIGNFNLQDTFT